jgi:hypothetical protein
MLVPEPPEPTRYTNNAIHAILTRHASTSTSDNNDSDVGQQSPKGLRAILDSYRTSSDDSESDSESDGESDNESDNDSDSESEKSNNEADTDSDVELLS